MAWVTALWAMLTRMKKPLAEKYGKTLSDLVVKLGPLEKWTYKARNGQVVFVLVGDVVTLEAAGPPDKKD